MSKKNASHDLGALYSKSEAGKVAHYNLKRWSRSFIPASISPKNSRS